MRPIATLITIHGYYSPLFNILKEYCSDLIELPVHQSNQGTPISIKGSQVFRGGRRCNKELTECLKEAHIGIEREREKKRGETLRER